MCRRDHLRSDLLRGAEFRETEASHICVDVHDIGRRAAKPLVKQFSAANDYSSLSLVARDPRRNRVSIHLESIQVVPPLRLAQRFGRRDQDFVPRGAQPFGELRYIDFGTAIRRRKVPTSGLNNAQWSVQLRLARLALGPSDYGADSA